MAEATTTDAGNGTGEFTPEQQAKIDAIVKDRLARQAAQLKKDIPDEDELTTLREAKKQLDAIEETSKDDLERANGTIEKLKSELADVKSENQGLTTKLRDTSVKQAVITEAAKVQFGEEKTDTFVNPEDAYRFLDTEQIEYDEEGNATNIADLIGGIAEKNSHLLGARRSAGPDMDLGPRETSTDRPDMSPEQEHAQWLADRI
jgi:hypothetical protein